MTLTSPTVMVQASFCRKWWLKWKLYSMFQNQRTAFPHLTAPLIYWKRAMVNIPIFILCLPAQPSARWLPTVTNRQTGRRCSRPTSYAGSAIDGGELSSCGHIGTGWTPARRLFLHQTLADTSIRWLYSVARYTQSHLNNCDVIAFTFLINELVNRNYG